MVNMSMSFVSLGAGQPLGWAEVAGVRLVDWMDWLIFHVLFLFVKYVT